MRIVHRQPERARAVKRRHSVERRGRRHSKATVYNSHRKDAGARGRARRHAGRRHWCRIHTLHLAAVFAPSSTTAPCCRSDADENGDTSDEELRQPPLVRSNRSSIAPDVAAVDTARPFETARIMVDGVRRRSRCQQQLGDVAACIMAAAALPDILSRVRQNICLGLSNAMISCQDINVNVSSDSCLLRSVHRSPRASGAGASGASGVCRRLSFSRCQRRSALETTYTRASIIFILNIIKTPWLHLHCPRVQWT